MVINWLTLTNPDPKPLLGPPLCSKNFPNIEQVKELFKRLDYDNDGYVTKTEMLENSQKFTSQVIEYIMYTN